MNFRNVIAVLLLFVAATALADSADLRLELANPNPGPVPEGQMDLYFGIRNGGPDTARDVVVTLHFPTGVNVTRIYGADATCDYNTVPLQCRVADLPGNGLLMSSFEITAVAPQGTVAELTIGAAITSSTPDPNPSNNTISRVYQVGPTQDLNVELTPGLVRIARNETFVSRLSITNYGERVEPRNIQLRLDAADGRIEAIDAPDGWTCSNQGTHALCSAAALDPNCRCSRDFQITTRAHDRANGGNVVLTARAFSADPEWYQENNFRVALAEVYREIVVTNGEDSGAGSLRAAVEDANRNCSPGPCRVTMNVTQPIVLQSPLPEIGASRVFLKGNGASIDGSRVDGPGLVFRSDCEVIVDGVSLSGFGDHAIVVSSAIPCSRHALDRRLIANNTLEGNLRGILIDRSWARIEKNVIRNNELSGIFSTGHAVYVYENTIEKNGRSGIYLAPRTTFAEILYNRISENAQMGVAVAIGAQQVDIRQNSMRANGGLGIDWNLDGISPIRDDDREGPSNAPTLFAATYDAARNVTVVTGRIETDPLGPWINSIGLDFYANASPDGDGERWVQPGGAQQNGSFTVELRGDLRGQWINATSTRTHWVAKVPGDVAAQSFAGGQSMTSELSNAVLVQ